MRYNQFRIRLKPPNSVWGDVAQQSCFGGPDTVPCLKSRCASQKRMCIAPYYVFYSSLLLADVR